MGVLRSASVRIFAAIGVAALLATCSAAAYYFLKPLVGDTAAWRLLFDVTTVSLILWVQIAFLFVKILFVNAEGVLELSFQLPLTNRERSAAFMIYEASMTGVVVGAGFISLAVTALLLLGPAAVPRLLESIIFPVVLTYLALSVIYLLLMRLCALLRLRPIENILLVLTMFTLLVTYSARMTMLVSDVSQAYLNGKNSLIWVTSLSWMSRRYGAFAAFAAATLLVFMLMFLALWLTPNRHVRHSRYLNVPVGGWLRRILGPYDWCLLRNSQTVVGASIALTLFAYLVLSPVANPIWGFAVLSVGGLYQFAATQPLRMLVGAASSPWRIYGQLLRAQLILLALFAVPGLAILSAVDAQTFTQSPLALLGCVGGAILTVCIGIVFPAEKDNPFSVFVGLSVTCIVLALAAIGLGVLQLPPPAVIGCLVGASALSIWYAVQGIRANESGRRNAQGTVGREFRRRVRATDRGDNGSNAALSHVHDR
jgi:hypothetical protein